MTSSVLLVSLLALLPVSAGPDIVDMGYRFKKGDRTAYRETTTIIMVSDFFHGGRRESKLQCTKTEVVQDVLKNGNGKILITVDEVQSWGPNVSEFSLIAAIEKRPILVEVSPEGEVVDITTQDPATPLQYSGVTLRHLLERTFHLMPTRPCHTGESWKKERVFSTDHPTVADIDQVVALHYTVGGTHACHGQLCTKITYSGTVLGTLKQGEMGSFEGKLDGFFLWQPDLGKEFEELQHHETTFHIASPEGIYQYEVRIEYSRRFLEPEAIDSGDSGLEFH